MDIRLKVFLPFLVSSHLWAYEEMEDQHYPRRSWLASFGNKLQGQLDINGWVLNNDLMRWVVNTAELQCCLLPGCLKERNTIIGSRKTLLNGLASRDRTSHVIIMVIEMASLAVYYLC
jgi:hypothetical protein